MTPEDVVATLDAIAREYDQFDYGLPMDIDHLHQMAAVVRKAIDEAVAAVVEKCARIAEGGSFLHDDAPTARFGREVAAAIRRG